LDYLLAAGGIIQIYLTGKKIRAGWLVGIGTSIAWVIFALHTNQFGFIISAAVFSAIHVKNYIAWGTRKHGEQ